jgi:hypothetical protein
MKRLGATSTKPILFHKLTEKNEVFQQSLFQIVAACVTLQRRRGS